MVEGILINGRDSRLLRMNLCSGLAKWQCARDRAKQDVSAPPFRRGRFGADVWALDVWAPSRLGAGRFGARFSNFVENTIYIS